MKAFILALVTFLSLTQNSHAIDQGTLDALKRQGFLVSMGELTGAGSKLSLHKLAGFIHPQGVIMKKDCTTIAVRPTSNTADPKISDVTKVVVDQSEVPAAQFVGFFTFE